MTGPAAGKKPGKAGERVYGEGLGFARFFGDTGGLGPILFHPRG